MPKFHISFLPQHRCLALDIAALHSRDTRTTLAVNGRKSPCTQRSCCSSPLPTFHIIFASASLPCADTRASSVFNGHKNSCTQRGCCAFPLPTYHNFIFAVLHLCRRSYSIIASTMLPCADPRASSVLIGHKYSRLLFVPSAVIAHLIFASGLLSMRRRC